jgi:hypothetical protein
MTTLKISLIASLIGTAAGFWAWKLHLTRIFWPNHPQLAGFFITLIITIAVQSLWPVDRAETSSRSQKR